MPSQTDLDQGGTNRVWVPNYLGPSIGWVWGPQENTLAITAAGSYVLNASTSLVTINVAGLVTIYLPTAILSSVLGNANAQPRLRVQNPITIVDIGGNAFNFNITIDPISGQPGYTGTVENIMGLSSISIAVNYGGFTLLPNSAQQGWNSISP